MNDPRTAPGDPRQASNPRHPQAVRWVKAGWLLDGGGGPAVENVVMEIHRGRIQSIRSIRDAADPWFQGAADLDLSDCTVMPGLVDSHVHLFMSGTGDRGKRERQLTAPFSEVRRTIAAHLRRHLDAGVAAVRDGGDSQGRLLRFMAEQPACPSRDPITVRLAGRAWHRLGRYGGTIGRPPAPGRTLAQAVGEDADRIHHVKIVNSGLNSLLRFGLQTPAQFDLDEMKAAVLAARSRQLRVMVHANGQVPVQIAVAAGCDSIEHGFFMGRDNMGRMADAQVFWVPTACTMEALNTPDFGEGSDGARRNLDHQLEQMRQARSLGVPVALGTDAGSYGVDHGWAVARELSLFMAAGYPVAEAVRCATANGARLLGLDGLGRLAAGLPATFVAVRGAPEDLPESLGEVVAVAARGRVIRAAGHVFCEKAASAAP